MKKRFALMAALIGGMTLMAACDDDDDNNGDSSLSAASYAGETSMTIMGMDFSTKDTVSVAMDAKGEYAEVSFAARSVTVSAMGNMAFGIGEFKIDSVEVSETSNGFTLTRRNKFSTEVSVSMGSQPAATRTATGTFGESVIKGTGAEIELTGLTMGSMPATLDFSFEGTKIEK